MTRPSGWLRFLTWMEILGGAIGLLAYCYAAIAYTSTIPTWHNLLAVAFFGANLIAGVLLLQARENGVALSFIVQLVQIVFWNSGIAWIARAGLHLTLVIASTGAGIFAGPAAEFLAHPVTTTAFSMGTGLGVALKLGVFVKPLDQATFACGVNLVALYFTLQLWRQLGTTPQATPVAMVSQPPRRGLDRWSLTVATSAVAMAGLFMVFGGPRAIQQPHQRWIVTTGDTLELFRYDVHTQAMLDIRDKSVSQERYLWVQFRSDFSDSARDRGNAAAVAQLSCRVADSAGVRRILVQPSQKRWMGLVTLSRDYSFSVDTAAHCGEYR